MTATPPGRGEARGAPGAEAEARGAPGAEAEPPLLDVQEMSAHADGAARPLVGRPAPGRALQDRPAPGRPLLDRVQLAVPAGAVTAVVGPSGSGKTTLGLAALGAHRTGVRLSGRALLSGTDLLRLPPTRRPPARAGVAAHLPQHPETVLDPVRRVGGALTELAALGHPERAARRPAARRALARVDLDWDTLNRRFPHQLSGGQQQRLALASALVTGARLLILDEPTSGLDPALAAALARTVRALADDGTGVLLLTHDLALVRETADRVLVLEHGRTVDDGPPRTVLGTATDARAPAPRPGPHPHPTRSPQPPPARHRATRALLAAERRTGTSTTATPRRAAPGRAAPVRAAPHGAGVTATGVVVRRRSGTPLAGPLSMTFPPGSRTALLGPSGSGKTTFARVLAGLTTPTRGEVRLDGRPLPRRIDRRTAAQRRAVQYVHQTSAASFEEHRPVLAQLATTARLLRALPDDEATAEAAEIAAALGLEAPLLHRTPDQLSGGQLQRCALVRALTARPALLVCDEVTSALDTVSRERLLDALPPLLAPADTALLLLSHDLPALRALTDTATLLEAGHPVRHGPLDTVLPTPPTRA